MGNEGNKHSMMGKNYAADKTPVPGPGHYDSHLQDGVKHHSGAKFSMGNEARGHDPIAREHNSKPGAGTYDHNANDKKRGPSYGFGSSRRPEIKDNGRPGPTAYRVPTKIVDVAMYSNAHGHVDHKFV